MMKHLICLTLMLTGITRPSFAQTTRQDMDKLAGRLDSLNRKDQQTSLYLSTSKDIYVAGEDLWFNAFVLNATDFTLSPLDNTLYLQLQKQGADSMLWQEMYPVNNGLSAGHVYLSQNLTKGDYLLKGYTAHSFFSGQPYNYGVARIQVVNDPQELRSRRNLQQQSSGTKEGILFNVFPEGGNLLAGVPNRVAFKAVNKEGLPVEVSGMLLKGDVPVLDFRTVHAGMGSFLFTPERNTAYHIKLADNKDSLYQVPMAREDGAGMRLIKNEGDSLTFKIIPKHPQGKNKFYLRLQVRGTVASIAAGAPGDSIDVKIPIHNAPQGIGEVTLFDEQLRPVAERLVYLHPERQLNISFSDIKAEYGRKGKVSLKVKTTDSNGAPAPAVFALRVYDDLFQNSANTGNIVSHYYLTTQIRGRIYDPSYYFDSTHKNRKEALDLLLLTQGWRRYAWSEEALREKMNLQPVLSDSLQAELIAAKKAGKEKKQVPLMLFSYNKSITQMAAADDAGRFQLTPAHLAIGPRFFVKYFSDKEYSIRVDDPFEAIRKAEALHPPAVSLPERSLVNQKRVTDTAYIPYGKTLKEVTISAKGPDFSDRYLGYLDSIAKYEGNMDYVGTCGWLNCPSDRTDIKPVEGKTYHTFSANITMHKNVILTPDNHKTVVYHYRKYTEEELLKKFKMAIETGYYKSREFYEPDYDKDKDNDAATDTRNTLLWRPVVVTDKNGEATIEFFCSDVTRQFTGMAEGVTGEGVLGVSKFSFRIR